MPLIPRRPNDPGYGPLGNIVALAENRAIGTSSADAGVLGASNTAAGVYGYSLGPPSAPGATHCASGPIHVTVFLSRQTTTMATPCQK